MFLFLLGKRGINEAKLSLGSYYYIVVESSRGDTLMVWCSSQFHWEMFVYCK